MDDIGLYKQLTDFTNEHAGTGEWCIVAKDGKKFFFKRFSNPSYPMRERYPEEEKFSRAQKRFHAAEKRLCEMYQCLRNANSSGALVVPLEVMTYQYRICTVAEYVVGNVKPQDICRLSEWQRIVLMRTLTLALKNIHQAGVVHSDIKTDNVLIAQNTDNGSCALRLIDFDASFMEMNPPDAEKVNGSIEYWAPEMFAIQTIPDIRLDNKIDIFALGIVFHEFWSGKKPAIALPKGYIGKCILNGDSVKLDALLPSSLRTIISKMLVADPAKRATAAQIYSDLEELLSQYPVKIVNLQKKPTIPNPAERKPPSVPIEKKPPVAPPKAETKYASVEVICRRNKGEVLSKRIEKVPYGESQWFYPADIKGYRLANGESAIKVTIDSKGKQDKKCEFVYKKKVINKLLGWIVDTCFHLLLALPLLTYFAAEMGQWDIAKFWKDLTPFYSQVFEEYSKNIDQAATTNQIIMCDESFLIGDSNQCHRQISRVASNGIQYLRFVPEETGYYTFTGIGKSEARGYICDGNKHVITSDATRGDVQILSIGRLFSIDYYFFKGKTYYLGVSMHDNQTIRIGVASK